MKSLEVTGDNARIEDVVDAVRLAMKRHPHLRFGQLVMNALDNPYFMADPDAAFLLRNYPP